MTQIIEDEFPNLNKLVLRKDSNCLKITHALDYIGVLPQNSPYHTISLSLEKKHPRLFTDLLHSPTKLPKIIKIHLRYSSDQISEWTDVTQYLQGYPRYATRKSHNKKRVPLFTLTASHIAY